MMRFNIFLLVTAMVLAIGLLIGGNLYVNRDIQQLTLEKLRYKNNLVQDTVEDFKKIQSPLYVMLAKHPLLLSFDSQKDPKPIQELFKSLVESNRAIMQLRFLDSQGNELVRVDRRRNGAVTVAQEDQLQNKAHRDYFATFSALPAGEIAFSDFDLNIENNRVEVPFNPTLRGGTKVLVDANESGLIIVNYYMKEWLYDFGRFGEGNIYLIDQDGFFLLHPDEKWAWSRYTTPPRKASQYFGKEVASLNFGNGDTLHWINNRTVAFPLHFFGTDLTVLYELNYSPTARYNEKSYLFALFVFISIALILMPLIKILRSYIRRLDNERHKAENMKNYLTSVFNNTFDAMIIINEKAIIQRVNSAALNTFGYSENELLGQNVNILVPYPHHDKHDDYVSAHDPLMTSKIIGMERELFGLHKDGKLIPISLGVTRIVIDGEPFFIGSLRDLSTEHKSRRQFETVFSEAPLGIALVLPDGHFWRLNHKFCHIVGYSNDEMLKLTFQEITHPDDLETDLALVEQVARGEIDTYSLEKRYITKSGDIIWINLTVSATFLDQSSQAVEYFIAMIEDITEIKRLEETEKKQEHMLLHQSKLAAMGEMLGAIAHQWRQPLNSIGLIIQDLVSAYKHNDLDAAYFKESETDIMHQLHYMSKTIDEFRNFFTQSDQTESCNIIDLIHEINNLYWAQAKAHGITIKTLCGGADGDFEPCDDEMASSDTYTIESHPAEIKQLLLNLIGNAKEAIENLEQATPEQKEISIHIISSENALVIEIFDLAGGIPETLAERIFEPYFTTKEMGTGLGLYIAKTLAETKLQGELQYLGAERQNGSIHYKGSIFRLTLPRSIETAEQ